MSRWEAIALLVIIFALGISSRWWGPLLDAYGRGLCVGLMSGVLIGQMGERRRKLEQTARDLDLAAKLAELTQRLERSVP